MIYILRHGLDDETRIGGFSDTPLTIEGINEVKRTILFMMSRKISFNQLYTSDIKRAKETAYLISRAYYAKIIEDARLRELDKGLLTGLSVMEASKRYPEYMKNVEINKKYPNGESLLDLYKRQKKYWIGF